MTSRPTGPFIAFEGGEGSGKSTQARAVAERTGAVLTHQPGATTLGAEIRRLTLERSAGDVCDRAEALLMAADRAQHVEETILPALRSGRSVVCDRYLGSSVAYQGHGRGLDPAAVRRISMWAADGLEPDLVVYLRVDAREAARRTGGPRDHIEAVGESFHRRVGEGFEAQARADPARWAVIDGSGTVAEVTRRVMDALADRLGFP